MNASGTPLLSITLPRTLDSWVAQFLREGWRGAQVEGWLFEGVAARRRAEARLLAAGVKATFRSAYKPLVHHFLEELDGRGLAAVTVRYPVHPDATPGRFLLEAYPLAALLPGCVLTFEAQAPSTDAPHYELALTLKDGRTLTQRVFAPNRVHGDHLDATLLSPTGWLRAGLPGHTVPQIDRAESTDYEEVFSRVVQCVRQHPWPTQEPYFERLDIRVDMPGIVQDLPLPLDPETISSHEALHEDLYFSLMEIFQRRSGRAELDRRLQPGQIVPDVRAIDGAPRVSIRLSPFDATAQDLRAVPQADDAPTLDQLGQPPLPSRIAGDMNALGGERFDATSRQGRTVHALYRAGTDAPVLISGGQHANETSGVVGALRAAQTLHTQAGAHFALIALENPDGYALHRELRAQHPLHMHHAARYSALGDDIEYRDGAPFYEREARQRALVLSGAQLHVNLHGYPAHEWTRPLSGYVPRGFGLWTIPKGFFLIMRHHAGWQAQCRALLEQVCAALSQVPGLAEYNQRQMALYRQHAGELPFEILHGFAFTQTETTAPGAPVTLITEFPDETVEGDAFRFAHTVQMQTVLAAVKAWQGLARRPA